MELYSKRWEEFVVVVGGPSYWRWASLFGTSLCPQERCVAASAVCTHSAPQGMVKPQRGKKKGKKKTLVGLVEVIWIRRVKKGRLYTRLG